MCKQHTIFSIYPKFFIFFSILAWLLILDQIFQFSNHYVLSNKLTLVASIENIKAYNNQQYKLDWKLVDQINKMEISILESSNVFLEMGQYIQQIKTWEISFNYIDYMWFISLQFFWLIFWCSITFQVIKKWRDWIWEFLGLFLFLTIIMFLWNFIFNFIGSLFLLHGSGQIILNIILNVVVILILFLIGKKKKK